MPARAPAPDLDVLALVPEAAIELDAVGSVVAVNDLLEAMFGYAAHEVVGRPVERVLRTREPLAAAAGPVPTRLKGEGRRANKVPFPVEVTLRRTGARVFCAVRELNHDALVGEARRYFDVAFDNAPIGMALFNSDGEYVRVNSALCTLLARTGDELLGRRDQDFTHPDDRQADIDAAWRILNGELSTHQCEKRFLRPDGTVVWALANLTFLRDELGRPLSWVGQFQDISERRRQEAYLRHMADHDPLTGALNRRAFQRALEQHLARAQRYGAGGAVLVLDLDGFKAVNDTLGHRVGDELLVRCVRGLRLRLRESDLLARLGGDEFAVLLPVGGAAEAEALAGALVEAVRSEGIGPDTPAMSVSVGAAVISGVGQDADQVIVEADNAMYEAKRRGRDGYTLRAPAPAAPVSAALG